MLGKEKFGYRVDEKIGEGAFGTVYRVTKTNAAGTYVRALKHITIPTAKQYASVLNSMGGDYEKADQYFSGALSDIVNEIRILSTLSESGVRNIVRYYENDITETVSPKSYNVYILMEHLTPFPDYVDKNGLTVREIIGLGRGISEALSACHKKKIVHRDIKDDNIFVSAEGVFKLGDFGVSKALDERSRAASMKGTPNYIAPEIFSGKEYDETVDIYSLGIVLYKLLNKTRFPFLPKYPLPYTVNDEDKAFDERISGKTPPLPVMAENALGEAILKAIMPRENRYNSADEFISALNAAEAQLTDKELDSTPCEVMKFPTRKISDNEEVENNSDTLPPPILDDSFSKDKTRIFREDEFTIGGVKNSDKAVFNINTDKKYENNVLAINDVVFEEKKEEAHRFDRNDTVAAVMAMSSPDGEDESDSEDENEDTPDTVEEIKAEEPVSDATSEENGNSEAADEADEPADEADESADEADEAADEADEADDEADEAADEADEAADEADEADDEADEPADEADDEADEPADEADEAEIETVAAEEVAEAPEQKPRREKASPFAKLFSKNKEKNKTKDAPMNTSKNNNKKVGIRYMDKKAYTVLSAIMLDAKNNKAISHKAIDDLKIAVDIAKFSKGFGEKKASDIAALEAEICEMIDALATYISDNTEESIAEAEKLAAQLKARMMLRDDLLKN